MVAVAVVLVAAVVAAVAAAVWLLKSNKELKYACLTTSPGEDVPRWAPCLGPSSSSRRSSGGVAVAVVVGCSGSGSGISSSHGSDGGSEVAVSQRSKQSQ